MTQLDITTVSKALGQVCPHAYLKEGAPLSVDGNGRVYVSDRNYVGCRITSDQKCYSDLRRCLLKQVWNLKL